MNLKGFSSTATFDDAPHLITNDESSEKLPKSLDSPRKTSDASVSKGIPYDRTTFPIELRERKVSIRKDHYLVNLFECPVPFYKPSQSDLSMSD